jgi:class 3 adenylate cyclase/pimeloyl-ACP methyl ester carboxylesterase
MELRMQYATTSDGVRIAFGTAGSGPPIVRWPSPPFSHSQLEWSQGSDFFDQLAAHFTIVQLDPRGCGLSDREAADLSLEARILDLQAVVDKLGFEQFALHGIGWSGPGAITYAVRHPERATHLILDDSQARTEDFFNIPQIRALDALTGDWESFLEFLVFSSFGLGRSEAGPYIAYLKACVGPVGAQAIFNAARTDDVTGLLPEVRVPTLIVQHSGPAGRNLQGAREMAAQIPDARLVVLEGLALDDNFKIVEAIGELLGTSAPTRARQEESPRFLPSSVRTILFTDMVEHTSMMRRLGDKAGRDVLRQHEELTREVLRRHGGDEVKTMGDGFMASFSSVTGAVECAIALQRAFEELHHGTGAGSQDEPIHVRIGLNAGEPIEEGGDLFGATVIMASRIAAQAGSGEILAADVVRGLCSGKGFLFADRGENVLRGFEDAVRLYEVRWRE